MNSRRIDFIQTKILSWYLVNKRPLAWRKTRDPYKIFLSEIMAQQTQAIRAEIYYKKWIQQFPNWNSLASASTGNVLRMWSGLGYNSRALRLHETAKIISTKYHSKLPADSIELQKLPGIGKYTAQAILCFAFKKQVPVVDVNIRRILTRVFSVVKSANEMYSEKIVWKIAEEILPPQNAFLWNQALMDLGAIVCTARSPKCRDCPISKKCASAFSNSLLIIKKVKKKEPSRKGIPRRLYRGKILKLLHHHKFTGDKISAIIWKSFSVQDVDWLEDLLQKMTADGLIVKKSKYFMLRE